MADVTITYNNNVIAEMDAAGTKTLNTSGCYCESNVVVDYAPNIRTYEITLAKASGWVLLTTLDEDVLAHINDASMTVMLINLSEYQYEHYTTSMVVASNTPYGMQESYPVYGCWNRQGKEGVAVNYSVFYPPNKTDTSESLGGARFRIDGSRYYLKARDGFIRTGTYRLVFQW